MAGKKGDEKAKEMGIYLNTNRAASSEAPAPSQAVVERVRHAADMLASGKSDRTVRKWFIQEYGLKDCTVDEYMSAVYRYLTPANWDEEKERVVSKNIKTLEKIVEKCMDKENYKTAREAIDSLNKMFGISGNNSITIAKNKEGEEIINISFE